MLIFAQRIQNAVKKSPQILNKIAQIDELKGLWKGRLALSPQILNRLKKSVVITSTGSSTRIEGSYLSDEEVKKLLQGLKVKKLKDRDSQEVAGYAELLQIIFDRYRDIRFNESTILHFHKIELKYSEKDQRHLGRYKTRPNVVIAWDEKGQEKIIFNPTPPYLVAKEMNETIDWTKKALKEQKAHPLLVISNFIYEFLTIHPFQDGNGRLSRALNNFLLLKAGYSYVAYISLEKIIEGTKADYYLALRESQKYHKTKRENILPWIEFFLNSLLVQAKLAKELVEKTKSEEILSPKQQKVLNLLDKKRDKITVAEVTKSLKIPRVTAKQILGRLLDLGLIERRGLGRATYYLRIMDDIITTKKGNDFHLEVTLEGGRYCGKAINLPRLEAVRSAKSVGVRAKAIGDTPEEVKEEILKILDKLGW